MTSPTPAPERPSVRAWRRLRRNWLAWAGAFLVALMVCIAVGAGWLAPHSVNERYQQHLPPSLEHPLGTDSYQYDVLTRVMYGARLSLVAGLTSIVIAVLVGGTFGAIAGYFGGRVDSLLMRTIDVSLAFPSILIALLVVTAFERGWMAVIVAVALINVPVFARQLRATVLTVRELDYVQAARALGASPRYVLWRVIAPTLISPTIVLATLGLGSAILEVAGLSFLGIAGDISVPEWGSMLSQAKEHLPASIWPALGPGVAISLTILGFNLLGDGLRDALDPRLSGGD